MARKKKSKKLPIFIPLFSNGNKLNSALVSETFINNERFYVKDVYGMVFRIEEKTYKLLKED